MVLEGALNIFHLKAFDVGVVFNIISVAFKHWTNSMIKVKTKTKAYSKI